MLRAAENGSAMHRCPVPGCQTRIAWWLTLCGWHWSRVPPALQREVAAANRDREYGVELTARQRGVIERAIAHAHTTLELKGAA